MIVPNDCVKRDNNVFTIAIQYLVILKIFSIDYSIIFAFE